MHDAYSYIRSKNRILDSSSKYVKFLPKDAIARALFLFLFPYGKVVVTFINLTSLESFAFLTLSFWNLSENGINFVCGNKVMNIYTFGNICRRAITRFAYWKLLLTTIALLKYYFLMVQFFWWMRIWLKQSCTVNRLLSSWFGYRNSHYSHILRQIEK